MKHIMYPIRSLLVLLAATAACTPPTRVAPTPEPKATTRATDGGAPLDWQHLDLEQDKVAGTGLRRAERELLTGRSPERTIVVAVIDGGIDTAHVDLAGHLWKNPKEIAGNGKDDDGNGYIDDVFGWNFIGGRDGKDVNWDTLELTRLHAACLAMTGTVPDSVRARCATVASTFEEKQRETAQQSTQINAIASTVERSVRILRSALGSDSVTADRVSALKPTADSVVRAQQLFLQMQASGISPAAVTEAKEELAQRLQYGLNVQYDPRSIVGDNASDLTERNYGNRNVMGPAPKHGTHVAGIIGALRNGQGVDGMAANVQIMALRAVPNGDERDKDVANAIRYAVDMGAQIINMSFGKDFSPTKSLVDQAVRYAESRGVLLVHAAGNDGADLTTTPSFPTPIYENRVRAANWIEVGASSWQGLDSLAASFSNYGKDRVDLFAPGQDVYSTLPGNSYGRESGTSMAAPVVTGVAATLMSYFPKLSAADVKRILLETATRLDQQMVVKPGSNEKVPFGTLSSTGGILNAYAAIKAALAWKGPIQ